MKFLEVGLYEPKGLVQRQMLQRLKKAGLKVRLLQSANELGRESLVLLGPNVPTPNKAAKRLREINPSVLVLQAQKKLLKPAHADGVVPLPISPNDLLARLPELAALRRRASRRPANGGAKPPERRAGEGILDEATGFYTFRHFKEVLFIEVKRARRYGFPLALALITFDPLGVSIEDVRDQLFGGLALAIRRSLRDTDFPVQYTPDRVLALMPHTDLQGALVVARRIAERVSKATLTHNNRVLRPTVSIGVSAAAARGKEMSFGELAHRAQQSMEFAIVLGGNRVEFQSSVEADSESGDSGSSQAED